MSTPKPAALARAARRHLERVRELLPGVRRGSHEAWDTAIRVALPTAPPDAREAWARCERLWWRLARTQTADIVQREAWTMARKVAHRMRHEDLVAYAWIGAYRAAQGWDPEQACGWRSFAGRGVRMHLDRYIRDGHAVYASAPDRRDARRIAAALADLEQRHGAATLAQAAEVVGITIERARRVHSLDRLVHLDAPVGEGVELDHHELVAADGPGLDELVERQIEVDRLRAALRRLPRLASTVLRRRAAGDTLDEIGDDLGYSREWIRRVERRGMARLCELMGVTNGPSTVRGPLVQDRVRDVVERHPDLAPAEIAEAIGAKPEQVHAALVRVRRQRGEPCST